jgi:hypothetical protein
MNTCKECNSDKLRWCWADGDIVCIDCGLVNQERIIDDRIYTRNDEYIDTVSFKNTEIARLANTFGENTNEDFVSTIHNKKNVTKKDVAKEAYVHVKGLTADAVCASLNIEKKTLWKMQPTFENNKSRCYDILKRFINQNTMLPTDKRWDVWKVGRQLLQSLERTPVLQSCKPDKLVVSITLVAMKCIKIDMGKSNQVTFLREYGLSLGTFRKHELLIQKALTTR